MEAESHPVSRGPSTSHCCSRARLHYFTHRKSQPRCSAQSISAFPQSSLTHWLCPNTRLGAEGCYITSPGSGHGLCFLVCMSMLAHPCRVLCCGHGLGEGSPTKPVRNAPGWLLTPQLTLRQEIPREEMREHSPVEKFQELTN